MYKVREVDNRPFSYPKRVSRSRDFFYVFVGNVRLIGVSFDSYF